MFIFIWNHTLLSIAMPQQVDIAWHSHYHDDRLIGLHDYSDITHDIRCGHVWWVGDSGATPDYIGT